MDINMHFFGKEEKKERIILYEERSRVVNFCSELKWLFILKRKFRTKQKAQACHTLSV